jgi:hypothetical protein
METRIVMVCTVGYSDNYVFFYKMIGVHGYIGAKSNSKTLLNMFFLNFELFLANWAFKDFKKALV